MKKGRSFPIRERRATTASDRAEAHISSTQEEPKTWESSRRSIRTRSKRMGRVIEECSAGSPN